MGRDEVRDGVSLTNLDQPLFDGAGADKRDLVDYLDAVHQLLIGELRDRPLSVIRVLRGQAPFMQKNVPKYTPEWVPTVSVWAEASKREVSYALCNDRRTLLWFANQRAVEYHPTLALAGHMDHPTYLILDIDPPEGGAFGVVVRAAHLVREALTGAGLAGAAGGATVAAAYSPRARPGVPVSFPVAWDDLDRVTPADFTVRTAPGLLAGSAPWAGQLPAPQSLSTELIEEGRAIPIARVQAMHEGKRRARARRTEDGA